jgi:tetratricopeptide (TPR) repeat protein
MLYFNRGLAYMHIEDYLKAKDDFTQTIELNPNYPHAYIKRGNTMLEIINKNMTDTITYNVKNLAKAAYQDFSKAIHLKPTFDLDQAYQGRLGCNMIFGNHSESAHDLVMLEQLNPQLGKKMRASIFKK